MMDSIDRAKVVRANLEAISRGKSPAPETVGVWLKEFQNIPTERLDDMIRQARTEHAERVEMGKAWGHITPDDVLRIYRRVKRKERGAVGGPPENLDCQYRCTSGRVSVRDDKGYECCVRCSCSAGAWWKAHKVFGRGPDVAECRGRPGWSLVGARPGPPLSESHRDWIEARARRVGTQEAIREFRSWSQKQSESS